MFTFANCLILIFFLFAATSSKLTDIQHQNLPHFWHNFMQENGIRDKKIEQMANEMDEIDPFIEKLSNLNQNSTLNELKHPAKQSLFFNLLELDNFYELVKVKAKIIARSDAPYVVPHNSMEA
uniref:Uncharacterized protein n=1 Tax=Globodera pallida TaxID=36090 RepID=A0A183BLB7_GLOPA